MLAEVSDQNFVDEDIKEEKTLGSCDAKRMKARILNVANNDQVMYNALCLRPSLGCSPSCGNGVLILFCLMCSFRLFHCASLLIPEDVTKNNISRAR